MSNDKRRVGTVHISYFVEVSADRLVDDLGVGCAAVIA